MLRTLGRLPLWFAFWMVWAAGTSLPGQDQPAQPDRAALAAAAARVKQRVAHRGASGERPENTKASTLAAIEAGATAVEVDVCTTADGHLVLLHDSRLDRTTSGTGAVGQISLAELKKLDAGSHFDRRYADERVPTLAEILKLCRGRIDVLLDLKEQGETYTRRVIETVRSHGDAREMIVGVRSVEQAKAFRELLPEARQLGLIASPNDIEAYAAAGVETIRLWPAWLVKEPSLAQRVHNAGAKLHINGTSGSRDEVVRALAYEPDSLSSDYPTRLAATLKALRENTRP